MTTWVQYLDDDTDYELQFIIKEVKKVLESKYTKTECVFDIIKLSVKDKGFIIKNIIEMKTNKTD